MPNFNLNDKKVMIIIIIAAIVIVALIATLIGVLVGQSCNNTQEPTPGPGGVIFDPSQGDKTEAPDQTSAPGVAIPGWGSLTIPANKKTVNCGFENPIENKDLYHLTFELRLIDPTKPEGYESIYKSGYVEAGKVINQMTLTRALEAGEYAAYIHVQPYRVSDNTPTNNANTAIKIIVK